jgi:hypothetical protein
MTNRCVPTEVHASCTNETDHDPIILRNRLSSPVGEQRLSAGDGNSASRRGRGFEGSDRPSHAGGLWAVPLEESLPALDPRATPPLLEMGGEEIL